MNTSDREIKMRQSKEQPLPLPLPLRILIYCLRAGVNDAAYQQSSAHHKAKVGGDRYVNRFVIWSRCERFPLYNHHRNLSASINILLIYNTEQRPTQLEDTMSEFQVGDKVECECPLSSLCSTEVPAHLFSSDYAIGGGGGGNENSSTTGVIEDSTSRACYPFPHQVKKK